MEMLNSEFDELCSESLCPDLFPKHLQEEINQLNNYIFDTINTGVYKCGFATSQVCSPSHSCTGFTSAACCILLHIVYQTKAGSGEDPNLCSEIFVTTVSRTQTFQDKRFECLFPVSRK